MQGAVGQLQEEEWRVFWAILSLWPHYQITLLGYKVNLPYGEAGLRYLSLLFLGKSSSQQPRFFWNPSLAPWTSITHHFGSETEKCLVFLAGAFQLLKVNGHLPTAYYSQSNGQNKQVNQLLEHSL